MNLKQFYVYFNEYYVTVEIYAFKWVNTNYDREYYFAFTYILAVYRII